MAFAVKINGDSLIAEVLIKSDRLLTVVSSPQMLKYGKFKHIRDFCFSYNK
jgi:hypothetical protein